MVNKVTFLRFRGGDRPNRPPWIRPWARSSWRAYIAARVGSRASPMRKRASPEKERPPGADEGMRVDKISPENWLVYVLTKLWGQKKYHTRPKEFSVVVEHVQGFYLPLVSW